MKAIRFDGSLGLKHDAPVPSREGEALVRVICAGICNTDLEIVKGYAGFNGTLGHEFVGRVVESPDESLLGRRVAGEINVGCNLCKLCLSGDSRHCPDRTVLGIKGRDGAFAEYLSLPARNLVVIPDSISDEAAVFTEPLAAACHILTQVEITPEDRVAVIGDGKLAQLIALVVRRTGCFLTVIGKHEDKLTRISAMGANAKRVDAGEPIQSSARRILEEGKDAPYDIVVEASGSATGLPLAMLLLKPRGTILLKSTHHQATQVEMSPLVVNESTIIGSRCGRFGPAIVMLAEQAFDPGLLISGQYSIDEGMAAFQHAALPTSLKVLIRVSDF